jgi:prepilin-type N-terminal cleavage/methylation domain-containing protein
MSQRSRQAGFTIIELVLALAITLIISSAIFAMISAGQSSFRREPELSDRQQNIRFAIFMITEDLRGAAVGLPTFAQYLTDGLNGVGPVGPTGANADELEIFTTGNCSQQPVCRSDGTTVTTFAPLPSCFTPPALVMLTDFDNWGVYWAEKPGAGATSACDAVGGGGGGGGGGGSDNNGHVTLPHGKDKFSNPPGGPGFDPTFLFPIQVVRYRIQVDAEGVPNLWRSPTGGVNLPDGSSSWQLLARGVEDLQVLYENGNGWQETPGITTCGANCESPGFGEYNTIVRNVQVALSARTTAPDLAGETNSAAGTGVRGTLGTQVAPRAVLLNLGAAGQWN